MLHLEIAWKHMALKNVSKGSTIKNSFLPPNTPAINAIAERVNRIMVKAACALMIWSCMQRFLWFATIKKIIYVRNRVPHATIALPLLKFFSGSHPEIKHIHVFRFTAFVQRLSQT